MEKAQLLKRLHYSMTKREVVQLAQSFSEIGVEPDELLRIATTSKYPTCFHAAWVLENTLTPLPEAIDYYLPAIIEHIPISQNQSVQRHLTKLAAFGLRRLIARKTARIFEKEFWKMNLEPLEDCCFQWLVVWKLYTFFQPDKNGLHKSCHTLSRTRFTWDLQDLKQKGVKFLKTLEGKATKYRIINTLKISVALNNLVII